ncbi:MAG: hypothetical protein ACE366_09445 [Bradymonadia bacterium]
MADLDIQFTHDHQEACRLRDAGYEPIECAFGQYGSVLGPLALDHHGTESHREGVALRACRDHHGARADDPRFVVTGTPDADAVLAIVALADLVPEGAISDQFYTLVNQHDTDPIGHDLMSTEAGLALAWFNQRPSMSQSAKGFRKAVTDMVRVLTQGLDAEDERHIRGSDRSRRRRAMEGIVALLDGDGFDVTVPARAEGLPVRRGDELFAHDGMVLVVKSTVWGFDQWYRMAPLVVSFASRLHKVTVGCPDVATAERLLGPGGLTAAWKLLGKGWGGREAIGGSPRGVQLTLDDARETAHRLCPLVARP